MSKATWIFYSGYKGVSQCHQAPWSYQVPGKRSEDMERMENHISLSHFLHKLDFFFFFHVLEENYYCIVKLRRKIMQAISRAWGIDLPLPGPVLRHALPLPNHTAVLHWGFTENSCDAQWLRQPGESTACSLFKCCDKQAVQAVIPSFGGIQKTSTSLYLLRAASWHFSLMGNWCVAVLTPVCRGNTMSHHQ